MGQLQLTFDHTNWRHFNNKINAFSFKYIASHRLPRSCDTIVKIFILYAVQNKTLFSKPNIEIRKHLSEASIEASFFQKFGSPALFCSFKTSPLRVQCISLSKRLR